MARLRTLDLGYEPGYVQQVAPGYPGLSPYTQPATWRGQKWMSDTVDNPGGQNPLALEIGNKILVLISGRVGAYILDRWVNQGSLSHITASTSQPSDNTVLTSARAKTNPSRPVMDVVQFLFELKDIPKMIKAFGDSIIRKRPVADPRSVANQFLSWEFGWKPLISDLAKIIDFTYLVDNRVKEIDALRQGGLQRSQTGWEDVSSTWTSGTTYASWLYGTVATYKITQNTQRKKWASMVWKPTVDLSGLTDDEVRSLAQKAVYNQSLAPQTLWQIMPWSWLIDWFTNIGDIVEGSRNLVPATSSEYCVMIQTTSRLTSAYWVYNPFGATISLGPAESLWKYRTPISGYSLEANLPFLDSRRLSILASLAIQRLS